MIESAIINRLKSDAALTALLSAHGGQPAIFSELAPEQAALPYLVIRCTRTATDNHAVQEFVVMTDYFNRDVSRANSRAAAERIEFLLDQQILTHERYSDIRINFFAGSPVEGSDPRDVHYNCQFQARATRKKWIIQT